MLAVSSTPESSHYVTTPDLTTSEETNLDDQVLGPGHLLHTLHLRASGGGLPALNWCLNPLWSGKVTQSLLKEHTLKESLSCLRGNAQFQILHFMTRCTLTQENSYSFTSRGTPRSPFPSHAMQEATEQWRSARPLFRMTCL